MAPLKTFLKWCFNKEIPHIDDRWGWIERTLLTGFIIIFTIAFVQFYPSIFLGFGLGDQFEWGIVISFFEKLKAYNIWLFYAGIGLLVFNVVFRMQVFLRGQWAYKSNHPDLPMRTLALLMSANALNIVFVLITTLFLGLVCWLFGYDFERGGSFVQMQVLAALDFTDRLPTLVELPLLLAFLMVYMIQGFAHYWIHRLCHLNRFLWLVLHRFHHMPPILTTATTTVVITSVPFFFGMIFIKTLIFAAISKLFYERPLFMEIFFFHLLLWIGEAYAHQTALYLEGLRTRWVLFLGQMQNGGTYHYLHHCNEEWVVQNNKTNQVNIGGGVFFCYDRLFGTYLPVNPNATRAPRVGLWGNPPLHHNPLRLLLSGLLQIGYELLHNKGLKTKLMCLVGPVSYTPPISKDFHISESVSVEKINATEPVNLAIPVS